MRVRLASICKLLHPRVDFWTKCSVLACCFIAIAVSSIPMDSRGILCAQIFSFRNRLILQHMLKRGSTKGIACMPFETKLCYIVCNLLTLEIYQATLLTE